MARDLSGKTALVTGASSGIGAAMARRLAAWRCNLVLSARRRDRLEALCSELSAAHGIDARAVPGDLADPGGPLRLHDDVTALGRPLDILINNAGFGAYQHFGDTAWSRHAEMLQLNVASLVELTHRFLPQLRTRPGQAHVLNVASVAAFIPVPYFSAYGAGKAYVLSFSRALAGELRGSGVRVTCLCPGGTATEFPEVAGQKLGAMARAGMMSAERVADAGLRGMLRGRQVVTPGGFNKFTGLAARLLPHRTMGAIAVRILGQPAQPPATEAGSRTLPPAESP